MEIKRPTSKQPIPPHAKKVFSGVMFDVWQWEQEQYDGSTATFEKLSRPDTVQVIPLMDDGRILLLKEEQPGKAPFISSAGGRVDLGEDVLAAAKRELREETGYEADEYILWDARHPATKVDWVVYTFVAKGLKKVGDLELDVGEKIELYPVSFDEYLDLIRRGEYHDTEVVIRVLQASCDPQKMAELRELFLPK